MDSSASKRGRGALLDRSGRSRASSTPGLDRRSAQLSPSSLKNIRLPRRRTRTRRRYRGVVKLTEDIGDRGRTPSAPRPADLHLLPLPQRLPQERDQPWLRGILRRERVEGRGVEPVVLVVGRLLLEVLLEVGELFLADRADRRAGVLLDELDHFRVVYPSVRRAVNRGGSGGVSPGMPTRWMWRALSASS